MATKKIVITTKRASARPAKTVVRKRAKGKSIDVKSVTGVKKFERKDKVFAAGATGTRGRGRSATSI